MKSENFNAKKKKKGELHFFIHSSVCCTAPRTHTMSADLEPALLRAIHEAGSIPDSGAWAEGRGLKAADLVGVLKSLEAADMVTVAVSDAIWRRGREKT